MLASRVARDGDRDGLPNVLLEAQSQGLPCVATRVSAIPELIEDGVNGILSPPGDPDALAAGIERLLRDATLRQRLGSAGGAPGAGRFLLGRGGRPARREVLRAARPGDPRRSHRPPLPRAAARRPAGRRRGARPAARPAGERPPARRTGRREDRVLRPAQVSRPSGAVRRSHPRAAPARGARAGRRSEGMGGRPRVPLPELRRGGRRRATGAPPGRRDPPGRTPDAALPEGGGGPAPLSLVHLSPPPQGAGLARSAW